MKENQTKPSKVMFADKAITILEGAVNEALREVPELDNIIVLFDWRGSLNDVAPLGIWLDTKGPIRGTQPGTLRSGIERVLLMLKNQTEALTTSITNLLKLVKEKQNEAENEASSTTQSADESRSAVGRVDGRHSDSHDDGSYGPAADRQREAEGERRMQEGEERIQRIEKEEAKKPGDDSFRKEIGEDQDNPTTASPVQDHHH